MQHSTFWQNWLPAWVNLRGIAHYDAIENGFCFELNDGKRVREWLLFSPENLAEILPHVSNRDYLCVSGVDDTFEPPQGWYRNMLAEMMICENLPQQAVAIPPNFAISSDENEQRVVLQLFDPNGELVCTGQVGFYQDYVVYDRIHTQEAFRRQGFGSLIMALLTQKAAERHIHKGLLCASEMGKLLYLSLGWQSIGQYVRIVREDYTRKG